MILRFGYVAMSVLLQDCSPSRTVTFKTYGSLKERDPGAALGRLRRAARENLDSTLRLIRHNLANRVKVYRFSSRLIPLATHPDLEGWDYLGDHRDLLARIGSLVRENGMRVSFHPDHFTLINSPREEVFQASMRDYAHHCRLLEAMGLDSRAKLVTHVGGGYGDREKSLGLFLVNWEKVPGFISGRITLENDDRTFTAGDVLSLGERLGLPVVLDLHHHLCRREEGSRLEEIAPRFLRTWLGTGINPKIHASSPRSETDPRSHHDYVDPGHVYTFLKMAAVYGQDLDVMVEAKKKDLAMFRLVEDLASFPGIKKIDRATLELT